MTTISQVIRHLRESRGLTRLELAHSSRLSRAHLWSIEQGKTAPSLATVEKLSATLNVGLGRMFNPSQDELLLEDAFVRAVHPFLRQLNCQQRRQLVKVLQAAPRHERARR